MASVSGAQPFYCPYCGEEDFVPSGPGGLVASVEVDHVSSGVAAPPASSDPRGFAESGDLGGLRSGTTTPRTSSGQEAFHCRSCDRRFVVGFLGLGPGGGGS